MGGAPCAARGGPARGRWRGAVLATLAALLAGCATTGGVGPVDGPPAEFPAVRFAVIADPHLLDLAASSPGPALDRGLAAGMKLQGESAAILAGVIAEIAAERPAFLLVCGDLTRDGERSAHELAAALLGALDDAGVPVLVVPGNHDVANPRAARYAGDAVEAAPGVTPEEFASIHAALGYGEALERDPASLSYVAEPVPGLRVLALDGCRYRGESGPRRTDGRLSPATRAWAARALARARSDGAAVIGMLHHAVVPRFEDMEAWLDGYLLDGHAAAARLLARSGARLVFTGHGHAQDITRRATPGGTLWDVATGSLVSWPNPWRIVELAPDGTVHVSSRRVLATAVHGDGFAAFSRQRLDDGLAASALAALGRLGVRGPSAAAIVARVVEAAAAHFAGDEPGPVGRIDRASLGPWSALAAAAARGLLDALGTDLPPADNEATFEVR